MATKVRLVAATLLIILPACGKDDTLPAQPHVGVLTGTWQGCTGPAQPFSLAIEDSLNGTTFWGMATFPSGTSYIDDGTLLGSSIGFTARGRTFRGTLDSSKIEASGTWISASGDSADMIIGEFQIAKDGSGANPECTTEPTRIQADVRLDGQLGINIIFSVLDYSGTIKNFGRAAARNPRVSVSSYNAQGALLATEVDDYITDLLGANETATFEIVSSVRPAQLDSTSVLVSWDPPGSVRPRHAGHASQPEPPPLTQAQAH